MHQRLRQQQNNRIQRDKMFERQMFIAVGCEFKCDSRSSRWNEVEILQNTHILWGQQTSSSETMPQTLLLRICHHQYRTSNLCGLWHIVLFKLHDEETWGEMRREWDIVLVEAVEFQEVQKVFICCWEGSGLRAYNLPLWSSILFYVWGRLVSRSSMQNIEQSCASSSSPSPSRKGHHSASKKYC